jgi:phospholipase DDHD1
LGSPLSVFLALRTRTPSNRSDLMPEHLCKRFYNIFHWSDPVAYRMEPLLERGYSKIEPVLIPSHGGVDSQQVEQQPPPSISNGDQSNSQSGNFTYNYNYFIKKFLIKFIFNVMMLLLQ